MLKLNIQIFKYLSDSICTTLKCRINLTDISCHYSLGTSILYLIKITDKIVIPKGSQAGAMKGTICDSGKSCLNGQCVTNPQAPTGTCLYGDDVVSRNDLVMDFPTPFMTCRSAIQFLISKGMDPVFYCQSQAFSFKSTCCDTCAGTFISEV